MAVEEIKRKLPRKKRPTTSPPVTGTDVKVETVPLPPRPEAKPGEGGEVEVNPFTSTSDGGLDAARAALNEPKYDPTSEGEKEPPVKPTKVDAKPMPEADQLPPLPPEKTLLMLTELATMMSCRMYAARMKVKFTDELKSALEFTKQEREDLETYAPYAAPLMGVMLAKYGMYIGAGIYGFVFWNVLVDRFGKVKEMAPKKAEGPKPIEEPEKK